MCGIIGIASNKPVSINIINSLKKLEYRGYDSAGLATLDNNLIDEKKCSGRVDELEKILFKNPSNGNIGIGHVRWATHGIPNIVNAHPHSSEEVSVVHNGIIENSDELKKNLEESEKQLADAQLVIATIRTDAEATASQVKSALLNEGKAEIERLTVVAKLQIGTIESKIRKQISDYVATLALQRVTFQLEGKLNSNLQNQIIDRNISKLGD